MARTPQDVTDAELSVLQILWDSGPSTIRELADQLYPDGGTGGYATVQKLLERLEGKRFVVRDRSGGAHTFEARVDRDELIGRRLEDIVDKLCDGSFTPLLTQLVRRPNLSRDEREALRELVDELDRERGRRNRKRRK